MNTRNAPVKDPKEYRRLLHAKRSELRSKLRARFDTAAELGRVAMEDQAPIFGDEFISVRMYRLAYEELRLIDAALDRLDSGDYGICVDCWAAISPKRLVAIPWASRCIACQERISSADECGAARRVGCLAGTEDGNPFGRRTGSQER